MVVKFRLNRSSDKSTFSANSVILFFAAVMSLTAFSGFGRAAVAENMGRMAMFDIPAQPVDSALLTYSDQADVQIIVAARNLTGIESQSVTGNMDVGAALETLLDSTSLTFEFASDDTVTVVSQAELPGDNSRLNKQDSNAQPFLRTNERSSGIPEILVTAEKRPNSLQRTPLSITAFTSDHLERSVIENLNDIGLLTPGVIVNKEIVGKIYIRGIGTENLTSGGDPGVAVHVDGAYVARTSAANFDLYDVERVEVLKGPQGTLYGRNATGGTINIISNKPTDEFYARAEAQYGSKDRFRFVGTINGPLNDKVLARASVVRSTRDGFTHNQFNGEDLDTEDLVMGRLSLRFLPTDKITFDVVGDFVVDNSKPAPFKQLEFSPLFEGMNGAFDPPGLRAVSQESLVAQEQDQLGVTGTLNWDLGAVTLTSITSYRNIDFFASFDGDAVDITFQNFQDRAQSHQISQEIRLASNEGGRFNWILGGYYFNDNGEQTIFIPIPGFGFNIRHTATFSTNAFAVFGQATLELLDNVNFTAGLRYNNEKKDANQLSDFGTLFPFPFMQKLNEDSDALTPHFALEYFPKEDVMLYASATRGFKSGGFTFNGFQSNFKPEFVWAYEVGAKTQYMDQRIQTNISAFYYNYSDLQVSKLENNAGVITNAADATIWGGELEFVARPTERIDFNVGLSYLNAKFDKFLTDDPSNPSLGTINLDGNRLTRSPKFTANIGAQYSYPVTNIGTASLRVDYQYQSKSFFTAFNRDLSSQNSFNLVNARLAYEDAEGKWTLAAFVKNAFDKVYFINILESGVETGKPEGFLAAPRTWGVQLAHVF